MSLRQTHAAGKHSFNKLFCLGDERIDPENEEESRRRRRLTSLYKLKSAGAEKLPGEGGELEISGTQEAISLACSLFKNTPFKAH